MQKFFSASQLNLKTYSTFSKKNPFKDIGIGKPLVIRLHSVYLGDLKDSIFNRKQDIIVASMMKDDITFDSPAKAVHQIYNNKKDKALLYPNARIEGSEIMYYSKAFNYRKLNIAIEVMADSFNENLLNQIANGFSLAAGIPVFLPYAPYILAGTQLMKVGGRIINRIVEQVPLLSYDFDIQEGIAGLGDSKSGFLYGTNNGSRSEFEGYEVKPISENSNNLGLFMGNKLYSGNVPYIIISLDGTAYSEYDSFKPTAAGASLLKRFYGQSDTTSIHDFKEITEIYNDYSYFKKIIKLQKDLAKNPVDKEEIEKLLEAHKKNIINTDIFNF